MAYFFKGQNVTPTVVIQSIDAALLTGGWQYSQIISLTPATFDVIYMAVGAFNEIRAYVRIRRESATILSLRAYSYWNPAGSFGFNVAGDTATTTVINFNYPIYTFVGRVDPYQFTMSIYDVMNMIYLSYVSFGCLNRATSLHTAMSGTAFSTGSIAPGASVTVALDRNLQGFLLPKQVITIISQDATYGANYENVYVKSVGASSVVLANVTKNYGAGALLGANPMPVYVSSNTALTSRHSYYFVFFSTYGRIGALNQVGQCYVNSSATAGQLDLLTLDQVYVFPLYVRDSSYKTNLGSMNHLVVCVKPTAGFSFEELTLVRGLGTANSYSAPWGNIGTMPYNNGNYQYLIGPDAY